MLTCKGRIEICKHIRCFWHSRPWQQIDSRWGVRPIFFFFPPPHLFSRHKSSLCILSQHVRNGTRLKIIRKEKTMQSDFSKKKKRKKNQRKKRQRENIMKINCALHLVKPLMHAVQACNSAQPLGIWMRCVGVQSLAKTWGRKGNKIEIHYCITSAELSTLPAHPCGGHLPSKPDLNSRSKITYQNG